MTILGVAVQKHVVCREKTPKGKWDIQENKVPDHEKMEVKEFIST